MPIQRKKPEPKELKAAHKDGRKEGHRAGLRDALYLLGLGLGVGLASTLLPKQQPDRCPKRSLLGSPCRLQLGHDGDCTPEGIPNGPAT